MSYNIVQENPNAIPEGETPHSVTLFAHDHLVDMAKPGDRITLTGIYKVEGMRVNPRIRMLKSVYKTFIDAIHISRDERSKMFTVKPDDSMADGLSQEKPQQESEEPTFQVSIFWFLTSMYRFTASCMASMSLQSLHRGLLG